MKLEKLVNDMLNLEKLLAVHQSSGLLGKMNSLKLQLYEMHNAKAEYALFRLRSSYCEEGRKCENY